MFRPVWLSVNLFDDRNRARDLDAASVCRLYHQQ
jgi:hypothetical protein